MTDTSYIRLSTAPVTGASYVSESFSQRSTSSPRVNGKLKLMANQWNLMKKRVSGATQSIDGDASLLPNPKVGEGSWNTPEGSRALQMSLLRARARFRGKLYKGSAALGVTLGSYKQSRDMIVNRAGQISDSALVLAHRLENDKRLRTRRSVAESYLEWVFGWQPLLADIHASCVSVIQQADQHTWVTARGTEQYTGQYKFNATSRDNYTGNVSCSISAGVRIENPNAWLLERAGLANPMAVAWDLVPWSFVVNMFVSTGALVNSITDFLGLAFENESTTYRGTCVGSIFQTNGDDSEIRRRSWMACRYSVQQASRQVGDIPRPPLVMKVPNANWELAAIAASLMVQRVSVVNRLLVLNPFVRS